MIVNVFLVLLQAAEDDPNFIEKIRGFWNAVTSGITDIFDFLVSGVSAFFTFLDTIQVSLNLPYYLTGVIPDILYAVITAVIGASVIKIIFTRGGSR